MRNKFIAHALIVTGALSFAFSAPAFAQDYPNRPIRIVAAFGLGSSAEGYIRALMPEMSRVLGQNIVMEYKPGAGGLIAMEYIAKQAPADGYALLLMTQPTIYHLLVKDLRFDPINDLVAVAAIAETPVVLGSPAVAPWNNFNEMVAYAKANPNKVNFGTSGRNQITLVLAALTQKHGIAVTDIPYKGSGPARPALLANEIQLLIYSEGNATADGDRVKILAVTGEHRRDALPSVPTFKELGMTDVLGFWFSLLVRAGTPPSIVDRLNFSVQQAVQTPGMKETFERQKGSLSNPSREFAVKRVADEAAINARLVNAAGMKPE